MNIGRYGVIVNGWVVAKTGNLMEYPRASGPLLQEIVSGPSTKRLIDSIIVFTLQPYDT